MTKSFISSILLFLIAGFLPVFGQITNPVTAIELSGEWKFKIDSLNSGVKDKWFNQLLDETVKLPGSMTTNGKGNDIDLHTPWTGSIFDSSYFRKPEYAVYRRTGNIKVPFWLQPVKYYKGAAWYQKEVNIPASWSGKRLKLYLERCHWRSTVWIDSKCLGSQNSLSVGHSYEFKKMSAGKHRLTVRIDNSVKEIDPGQNSHSITDHTQTNWNGMIGKLSLSVLPDLRIVNAQLYPDLKRREVVVSFSIASDLIKEAAVTINLKAENYSKNVPATQAKLMSVRVAGALTKCTISYPMGKTFALWDEFSPQLYHMSIALSSNGLSGESQVIPFGMREFSTNRKNFTINGRKTFMRGALECAVFPKTGYPATDVASWLRILKVCRSYGLNHIRFHSWCPPEAAFVAADSLGFYLQIECPSWANQGATIGDGKPLDNFIYEESRRIVSAYGNHPSFCMLTYGNEPAGKNMIPYLTGFVNYWKSRDPRRLYTTGAGWPLIAQSDYNSHSNPRIQHWEEGLKSVINAMPPSTDYDWSSIIKTWKQPTISHEIGQWCVYPDMSEIAKYDGVLKAKNFEIFQDRLKANKLQDLSAEFLHASGKLQAICYKADIEAALRTPGFGGFQLLGLSDFPGQGTALVGVLNAFWEDKGYISPNEYSQFCNSVVPLARMPKLIYTSNETFQANVEIAQFGPHILKGAIPVWTIEDQGQKVLFSGRFAEQDIPFGNGQKIGQIKQLLSGIGVATQLKLIVQVGEYRNSWDFFVYPEVLQEAGQSILVTQKLDETAMTLLKNGGKVLLTLKQNTLKPEFGGKIQIGFSSIFWNTAWTNGQAPFSLGVTVDPKHPALNDFPTEKHSNWQYWDAMTHSNAIMLDSITPGLKPIIRVIDDWVTARSLGLIFECRIGNGKLIVSSIDLFAEADNRPVARQLLYSLKRYMESDAFDPEPVIEVQKIRRLNSF